MQREEFRNRYSSLVSQLNYQLDKRKDHYPWAAGEKMKENLEIILALSLIHRLIILPFESAGTFFAKIESHGGKQLSVGSNVLNSETSLELVKIAIEFNQIIRGYGIDSILFSYSDVEDFLYRYSRFYIEPEKSEKNE